MYKKSISMKKRFFIYSLCATLSLMSSSCSDTEKEMVAQSEYLQNICVTGEDVQFENELATRTSYASNLAFSWSLGDTLGIYPIGADQVSFPISSGEGSKSADFDGGAWALRSSYQYAGYFPFSAKNYHNSIDAIPFSFEGQTQNGNNGMTHFSKYDYMASAATAPTASGSVSLQMKRLGCFMRLSLTVPAPSTLTSVTVESAGVKFGTEGTFDLSAATPQLNVTKTSSSITMALTNVTTTTANENVLLWMLTAPVDMSAETLTISVTASNGEVFSGEVAGKKMVANGGYGYVVTLKGIYNGHEYVDLGLPSGLRWATCNIGASEPEDCGDYFAWGEIEPYYTEGHAQDNPCSSWKTGKTGYDYANYKWCNGSSATLTKYCTNSNYGTVDNKTELDPEDDAAHVNWEGNWRMPTFKEMDELCNNCTWTWEAKNGVNGYKVTGTNGNWIFLPATGYREYSNIREDWYGYYWSSSQYGQDRAYDLCFVRYDAEYDYHYRKNGMCVRPVIE